MHVKLTEQGIDGNASYMHIGAQNNVDAAALRCLNEVLQKIPLSDLIELINEEIEGPSDIVMNDYDDEG